MEKVKIETNKREYDPGELIFAKVHLNLKEPTNARSIHATLYCHEEKKVTSYTIIPQDEMMRMRELGLQIYTNVKQVQRVEQCDTHRSEKTVAYEGTYQKEKFEISFELPKNCQPSSNIMGHDNRITKWMLKIRINIPFSTDINVEKEIFVKGL
ncbi:hypothetical protein HYT84_02625 [Candidatus Micrarchaeota archaeon]|nr:hypothetical protein [Candidatus Micrarchaeota archaeon]